MMRILLVYDITEDKVRSKIADVCEDYGLDRFQYSAFTGELSRNHQEELMLRIEKLLGETSGYIRLVPISGDDWAARLEVGNA
jgi:CRISPR-associated protein Cas2